MPVLNGKHWRLLPLKSHYSPLSGVSAVHEEEATDVNKIEERNNKYLFVNYQNYCTILSLGRPTSLRNDHWPTDFTIKSRVRGEDTDSKDNTGQHRKLL